MITVNFYDTADDGLLKFAVIITKYCGKWVFCKHGHSYDCDRRRNCRSI